MTDRITERPYMVSADLGETAHKALGEVAKRNKMSYSATIRKLILMEYTHNLMGRINNATATVAKQGKKGKMTDDERAMIEIYKDVFSYKKQIFYPPALSAIRAAIATGLTYGELEEIIRVSPNDGWIAQQITRGVTPQLHMILSEKMIARLWDLAQEALTADAERARLDLEGTVKPEALRTLKDLLTTDQYSVAWDMVQDAMSENDVRVVVKAAMENRWAEFQQDVEEATKIFEEALSGGD